MSDLVALLRQRSMEKVAVDIKKMYDTASTALSGRGINPIGAMAGTALGTVGGAIKGYQSAGEDDKWKGAITGGALGGVAGGLMGHAVGSSVSNLKGIRKELADTKAAYDDAYKVKHDMDFVDRMKARFGSAADKQKLEEANKKFNEAKKVAKDALSAENARLSGEKVKIQMNPNLSYDDQVKQIDALYGSSVAGRREMAVDKLKGNIFQPLAMGLTAGAINSAGTSAFAPVDSENVISSLRAKKNLTDQDRFIINEKMNQIRQQQGSQQSSAM